MRRDLKSWRRHFFNKRISFLNYASPDTKPEEMLVDDSAAATVRELGESLTDAQYQEARTLVQKLRVILRKRCDAANGLQPGAQPPADRDLLH